MATLESIRDFTSQYHDIIQPDEAAVINREANRYLVGGLVPRTALGYVLKGYLALFLKFEATPEPEIPDPETHRGAI
jgi:hypothetical protein